MGLVFNDFFFQENIDVILYFRLHWKKDDAQSWDNAESWRGAGIHWQITYTNFKLKDR